MYSVVINCPKPRERVIEVMVGDSLGKDIKGAQDAGKTGSKIGTAEFELLS